MTQPPPSFMRRIPMAFGAFFSTLSSADYAVRLPHPETDATVAEAPLAAPVPPPPPAPTPLKQATPEAALQLLALLQRDGRLIDFTQEDIRAHADAE